MHPAPSPSTHRPSCASTESSPQLSPWRWKRSEAGGNGREPVRCGGWSFSSPPFSFQLLRIGGRVSAGDGVAWRKDQQSDIQGWERSHLPSALAPAVPEGRREERVTGTKRDKQRIIFQATTHQLKPKQRNNFPASTALNRWNKPLQQQAGVSGLRKPVPPRPQGDYPGWLGCFQAQTASPSL